MRSTSSVAPTSPHHILVPAVRQGWQVGSCTTRAQQSSRSCWFVLALPYTFHGSSTDDLLKACQLPQALGQNRKLLRLLPGPLRKARRRSKRSSSATTRKPQELVLLSRRCLPSEPVQLLLLLLLSPRRRRRCRYVAESNLVARELELT